MLQDNSVPKVSSDAAIAAEQQQLLRVNGNNNTRSGRNSSKKTNSGSAAGTPLPSSPISDKEDESATRASPARNKERNSPQRGTRRPRSAFDKDDDKEQQPQEQESVVETPAPLPEVEQQQQEPQPEQREQHYTTDSLRREREARVIVTAKSDARVNLNFNASLSLKALKAGTAHHQQMMECYNSGHERGVMWDYELRLCVSIPGFKTPLHTGDWGEVSEQELTCSPDSLYEARRPPHLPKWLKFAFKHFQDRSGVLQQFNIPLDGIERAAEEAQVQWDRASEVAKIVRKRAQARSPQPNSSSATDDSNTMQKKSNNSSNSSTSPEGHQQALTTGAPATLPTSAVEEDAVNVSLRVYQEAYASLMRQYSRWFFFTSWLFRQWLPWQPHPRPPQRFSSRFLDPNVRLAPRPQTVWRTRGYHDPHVESVYVLEYFCVGPVGLAGHDPAMAAYIGKDDSRDKYHGEAGWKSYFNTINRIAPPSFFDERPVFFFPAMELSRHNQAHLSLKLFSMVAMLEFAFEDSSSQQGNRRQQWRRDVGEDEQRTKRFDGNFSTLEEFAGAAEEEDDRDDAERDWGNKEEEEEKEKKNVRGGTQRRRQRQKQRQRVPPFENSEFVPGSGTDHWNPHSGLKPLIVVVFNPSPSTPNEKQRTTAIGFYLRILDLPWAVSLVAYPGENYLQAMYGLTKHAGALPERYFAAPATDSSSTAAQAATEDDVAAAPSSPKRRGNNDGGRYDGDGQQRLLRREQIRQQMKQQGRRRAVGQDAAGINNNNGGGSSGGAFSESDQTHLCFRRGSVWMNCIHCDGENPSSEHKTEASFGFWTALTAKRRVVLDRVLQLTANCLTVPGRAGFLPIVRQSMLSLPPLAASVADSKSNGNNNRNNNNNNNKLRSDSTLLDSRALSTMSQNRSKYVPPLISAVDMIAPKHDFELPNLFILVRSTTRKMTYMPLILDGIFRGLRGFVNDIRVREPWRGSRMQYVNEMRTSDVVLATHGGALGEAFQLRPRPMILEINAAFEGCGPDRGPGESGLGAACWFGNNVGEATRASYWVLQVDQMQETSFQAQGNYLVDLLRAGVCRWYKMNPRRRYPNRRLQLYCSDTEQGGLMRHRTHHFFDKNKGDFPVELSEVQRCLRDEFGVVMASSDAIALIQRLKAFDSKSGTKLHLSSPQPYFFETLLRRFVDFSIQVKYQQPSRENQALCMTTLLYGDDIPEPEPETTTPAPAVARRSSKNNNESIAPEEETSAPPPPPPRTPAPARYILGKPGGNLTLCLHAIARGR